SQRPPARARAGRSLRGGRERRRLSRDAATHARGRGGRCGTDCPPREAAARATRSRRRRRERGAGPLVGGGAGPRGRGGGVGRRLARTCIPRRLTTWITPTARRAVAVRLDRAAINGPS